MKKVLLLITTLLFYNMSNSQIFKLFQCSMTKTDSCISVYSLTTIFEVNTTKGSRLELVKEQLSKKCQIDTNNVISIESFRGKRYRTFFYRVMVENVKGCSESDEKKK